MSAVESITLNTSAEVRHRHHFSIRLIESEHVEHEVGIKMLEKECISRHNSRIIMRKIVDIDLKVQTPLAILI